MNAAFVFGTLGNVAPGSLGSGWSIEEAFAWCVGAESVLTIPLPGDDLEYILTFSVEPAIYPPAVTRQHLTVKAGDVTLGDFTLTGLGTLSIPLPLELTNGARSLRLTLLHPDAARPSQHGRGEDSRLLSVRFNALAIMEARSAASSLRDQTDPLSLEPVHGLIAGGVVSMRIAEIISRLPSLRGRFGIRYLDTSRRLADATDRLPPGTLDSAAFCWIENTAGSAASRDALRKGVPSDCRLLDYYTPAVKAMWPFLTPDDRAVAEHGRYLPSRYGYGDRHARALATMNMPDDVVHLMYEMATGQDPIDLSALFADDMRRWRAADENTDLVLADFIEANFTAKRLFIAPDLPGPDLLRIMVDQVIAGAVPPGTADSATVKAELDFLLDGYVGWQSELPVHSRVGKHFGFAWWSPEMRYKWQNNRRTHREHILDSIRWAEWRP